jgi:hypothetical protein
MLRLATVVLLLAAAGCEETLVKSDVPAAPLPAVSAAALERLAHKRIYFGHQSVGYNLVDGLKAVAAERSLPLRVVETRKASDLQPGTFAHSANGKNEEPLTKIRDFAQTLDGDLGANVDIAFFKFCYIDFTPGADVQKLFTEYRAALAHLRVAHPAVRFVHVTAPLTVVAAGPKAWLKGLLGKKPWGADANVVRERFNNLLRKEYGGKEPLFDLAAVEASRPNGTVQTFRLDGASYPALTPAYASDGKHLNDAGARWAAAHLLATLASVAE